MKHNQFLLVVLFAAIGCFVGCNHTTQISGTVKFSDGTPVDFGSVAFDDGKSCYFGTIKQDGTYVTGGVQEVEGIPDGNYKVYLAATETKINEKYSPDGLSVISYDTVQRVAEKYRSVGKTDLTFEVKRGGAKTFDIVVEKP